MNTILHAVRELAQKWQEQFRVLKGHRAGTYRICSDELIALADRSEAESQREGREDHNPVIGMLCDDPAIVARQAELAATPSHPQREGREPDRSVPPCLECGARTAQEAETKCICAGDKDYCHGEELWPDTPNRATMREAAQSMVDDLYDTANTPPEPRT